MLLKPSQKVYEKPKAMGCAARARAEGGGHGRDRTPTTIHLVDASQHLASCLLASCWLSASLLGARCAHLQARRGVGHGPSGGVDDADREVAVHHVLAREGREESTVRPVRGRL
jgi:hypothetical protein